MTDPPGTKWLKAARRPPTSEHYEAALRELKLTPQEQYAYQHHLNNLALGGVRHPDGSVSSFLNMTVGFGDKTYVLPTVWDNKIIGQEEAIRRAQAEGLDKWPSYENEQAASKRYDQMHGYMERDTAHAR